MQESGEAELSSSQSELEGAILSELRHRGPQTAFRVRKSFAESPSLEWRGSAGSVYAAIRRLESAGLIGGEVQGDRRGARLLRITDKGSDALTAWACDVSRAIGVGVDPFRLRSGTWEALDSAARLELLAQLEAGLIRNIEALRGHRRHGDVIETVSADLAVRLQQSRLDWLRSLPACGRNNTSRRDRDCK